MAFELSTLSRLRRAFASFLFQWFTAAVAFAGADLGGWRPVIVPGAELTCLRGARSTEISVLVCGDRCRPIPWQLDERDPSGELVLDRGPAATADSDGGRCDANDELVFLWSDAGRDAARAAPDAICGHTVSIRVGTAERSVFIARYAEGKAPASPVRYVAYDETADRMVGDMIELTFAGPTPRGLALRRGPAAGRNLLDRLKIRAYARFFGVFPLWRDEDDILSVYEAWRVGPIRVIRRERKWVRLAFGFRTPYMRTETTFYPNFSILPVRLRLNYAPAQLLSDIELRAALDFANLEGWRVWAPGLAQPLRVGAGARQPELRLDGVNLVVLEGGDASFATRLLLGESLQSLAVSLLYEDGGDGDAPERVRGQRPGAGFRLTEWGEVERGPHWFAAESFALPPATSGPGFAAEIAKVTEVEVEPAESDSRRLTPASPIH